MRGTLGYDGQPLDDDALAQAVLASYDANTRRTPVESRVDQPLRVAPCRGDRIEANVDAGDVAMSAMTMADGRIAARVRVGHGIAYASYETGALAIVRRAGREVFIDAIGTYYDGGHVEWSTRVVAGVPVIVRSTASRSVHHDQEGPETGGVEELYSQKPDGTFAVGRVPRWYDAPEEGQEDWIRTMRSSDGPEDAHTGAFVVREQWTFVHRGKNGVTRHVDVDRRYVWTHGELAVTPKDDEPKP